MVHSTLNQKPTKPYPDFPLFPHATKRWAKKIRGKLHSFGPWDDWQAALNKYPEQRDDLYAGRTPRTKTDGITIRDLCNRFLTAKQHLLDTGEIVQCTFQNYYASCKNLMKAIGKMRRVDDLDASDFEQLPHKLLWPVGPIRSMPIIPSTMSRHGRIVLFK